MIKIVTVAIAIALFSYLCYIHPKPLGGSVSLRAAHTVNRQPGKLFPEHHLKGKKMGINARLNQGRHVDNSTMSVSAKKSDNRANKPMDRGSQVDREAENFRKNFRHQGTPLWKTAGRA